MEKRGRNKLEERERRCRREKRGREERKEVEERESRLRRQKEGRGDKLLTDVFWRLS